MDKEIVLIVVLIVHLVISEGNVADNHIKAVILKCSLFKALYLNIRTGIELLCDPACQVIKLNTMKLAATHTLRHNSEEIADTHCRLKDFSFFKANIRKSFIYGIDYNG